jgi:nitroreductase
MIRTREPLARSRRDVARDARKAAEWAPSVHNARPWTLGVRGSRISLHADAERLVEAADPDGREMLISCGAALFTLRVAIKALGYRPQVDLLPDPDRPHLLADVQPGTPAGCDEHARRLYRVVRRRRTHDGGFRPGEIEPALRSALRREAEHEGVRLVQAAQGHVQRELAALTQAAEHLRWLTMAQDVPESRQAGSPAGLFVLITTPGDETLDWIRAGQALQRMLLRAAQEGLAAAFHPWALEIPELRERIRTRFCDDWCPQVLLRLGVPDGPESAAVRRLPDRLIA